MMRRSMVILAMALCSCKPAGKQADQGDKDDGRGMSVEVRSQVGPLDDFSFRLYENARELPNNLVLSPLSVAVALGFVYRGAAGQTATQMVDALRLGPEAAELKVREEALAATLGPSIVIRIWTDNSMAPSEPVRKAIESNKATSLSSLDFAGGAEKSRDSVNGWFKEEMGPAMPDILWKDSADDKVRILVTTAAHFTPKWRKPFPVSRTAPAPFRFLPTDPGTVPTMVQTGTFTYADLEFLELLELPCEGDVVVTVLLPKPGHPLTTVEEAMLSGQLPRWLEKAKARPVEVHLPKFSVATHRGLSKPLAVMGMQRAFGLEAELAGVAGAEHVGIGEVVHHALLRFEEGSEKVTADREVTPEVRFVASRPFAFVVRNAKTGTNLFMGRFVRP